LVGGKIIKMKKVLLVVGLVVMFVNNVYANVMEDLEKERIQFGYYDGDPNQTQILESTDEYIVLRNLTAKVEVYIPTLDYTEASEVFVMEAKNHCKKNKFFFTVYNNGSTPIDEHTLIFFCDAGLIDVLDKEYKDYKNSTWNDRHTLSLCATYWKVDNPELYRTQKCDRLIKKQFKKWPKAKTFVDKILSRRAKHEDRSFIFEIKKRVLAKASQPSISTEDQNTVVAASSGTGFFVSTNGHMVTNNHVIEGCDVVKAHYKGRELDADVLFTDRSNDLAIIKANIKPEKVFPVSNEDVSLLEDIIVAGYPLGKNISASIKTFKGSVTALAGFGDNYSNFQIDASLSSGNSGGPIINQKGNVVGVAVEKLVEVGVEGFNFGVKSSTLKTFASSNQIKFQDPSTEELSNKELGQLITEATIYLECWMSVAKIKQIIEEGERQKAFFSEYK
jgi:hypothetical protein